MMHITTIPYRITADPGHSASAYCLQCNYAGRISGTMRTVLFAT